MSHAKAQYKLEWAQRGGAALPYIHLKVVGNGFGHQALSTASDGRLVITHQLGRLLFDDSLLVNRNDSLLAIHDSVSITWGNNEGMLLTYASTGRPMW